MIRATIVGAGGWGTALSVLLATKGVDTTLWVRNSELAAAMKANRVNEPYLSGITLPEAVAIENDLATAVRGASVVVLVVPSQAVRGICDSVAEMLSSDVLVVNAAKGFERDTLHRMSEVVEECMPQFTGRVVTLSGPNHAEEVGRMIPSATVVASHDRASSAKAQALFMSPSFRVYTNEDVTGVEVAGSMKNVVALAAGISDGLGYGDNTKAALMTRGMAEMARIGVGLGAEPLTFAGLAGIGDLIATCTSRHSRNARAGRAIGEGRTVEEVLSSTTMVVEGVHTAIAAKRLSERLNVEMPIAAKVYEILFEGRDARQAVSDLMGRDATREETSFMHDAYQLP
jgi:glycerol-3-phosphate dehydrogenase (NAD(P)+)